MTAARYISAAATSGLQPGALLIKTDTTGNGEIWFPVHKRTAHGTVECAGTSKPTRVTTITGMTPVADDTKTVKFTVTRAGI